jgi:type IV pilus assembly protein PilY1
MKPINHIKSIVILLFCVCLSLSTWLALNNSHATINCDAAGQYSSKPIFVSNAVTPNVLILFSNDHTNFYPGYSASGYDDSKEYYGYFDPKKEYIYSNNTFSPVGYVVYDDNHHITTAGRWSGNFMNFLTMCHADFVRKALTGGKRHIDSSSFTTLERGSIPNDDHRWSKTISDASLYTSFTGQQTFSNVGITMFRDPNGNKVLDTDETEYTVRVEVCNDTVGVEENGIYYENGHVWKPEGLLQRFRDKVNFGLMTYSYGKTDTGGVMRVNVKDISEEINPSGGTIANADGIIGFINGFQQKGWDPVAEMYYEAVRYFKGLTPTPEYTVNSPDGGFQVLCNQGGQTHNWEAPITSWCQKNFIIIVNDEYPSKDSNSLPGSSWPTSISDGMDINVTALTKTVGDLEGITGTSRIVGNIIGDEDDTCDNKTITNLGQVRGICPSEDWAEGSYYIAGLAYYAHTTDLDDDLPEGQHITTYSIAFRASPDGYQVPPPPMNQLYLAAKYGGFNDLNHNNEPDAGEWEGTVEGGYTWPKNFAHAESGNDFEASMLRILTEILRQSSSGTAASVVTSSEGGEGQLFQAYFEPARGNTEGTEEISWVGFLHSLWIDRFGNLREDSVVDHKLVLAQNGVTQDKIVHVRFDNASNTTVVDRYLDDDADGAPDTTSPNSTTPLTEVQPVWEASKVLAQRNLGLTPRVIKTFIDKNVDQVVDSGEFVDFSTANKNALLPFLKVSSADLDNLVNYINGTEVTGWRSRTLDDEIYLLGDIVHSSPTPVGRPMDNYDVINGDKTYLTYYNKYRNRPTYVYTGANDGMLHAFYGGIFHATDDPATNNLTEAAYLEIEANRTLGEEVWAYVPNNLLSHLQWLTCLNYPHVYYVDLKPKIVDARIFSSEWTNPNGTHPYGWGTILISGMRFGGPSVTIRADFDGAGDSGQKTRSFKSAYFALDITNPQSPQLLWEKTYSEMGYTFSYPSILRVQNGTSSPTSVAYADQKWMLAMGNGPIDFNGDPGGSGYVYVVDLLTGALVRQIATPALTGDREFVSSSASVDLKINYDVDVIYMGSTIKSSQGYGGKMYRLATDSSDSGATPDWSVANWTLSTLIDAGKPITAAPGVAQIDDHIWVYFGTGRYISTPDKTTTDQQKFFGVKDPCSFAYGTCPSTSPSVAEDTNLVNVTGIKVYETGYVTGVDAGNQWSNLTNLFTAANIYGFVLNLEQPEDESPSERILAKPAIIGGLTIFPSFFPNDDVCSYSGESRLYGLYYATGTAFKKDVIGTDAMDTVTVDTNTLEKINSYVDIGAGLPSQVAIHIGSEDGGKTFTQMSTASILELEFTPAQKMKSGFFSWQELK